MSGCFGNHPEDKMRERELHAYLATQDKDSKRDEQVKELANDKYMALPLKYKSSDGVERYTNIEDAFSSLKTADFEALGRLTRDRQHEELGILFCDIMNRICFEHAESEID